MRVAGGKYRGRKLFSPEDNSVRPTHDMVKEAVFSSLGTRIIGAVFIDLFSGSGAMGIEAASRGAEQVIFCDKNLALTKKNLHFIQERHTLLEGDYAVNIRALAGCRADIIYIDPPYADKILLNTLTAAEQYVILADDGIAVYESESDCVELPDSYILYKSRKYGRARIHYIIKKGADE